MLQKNQYKYEKLIKIAWYIKALVFDRILRHQLGMWSVLILLRFNKIKKSCKSDDSDIDSKDSKVLLLSIDFNIDSIVEVKDICDDKVLMIDIMDLI